MWQVLKKINILKSLFYRFLTLFKILTGAGDVYQMTEKEEDHPASP